MALHGNQAPECHERCEKMIEEVKHLLLSEMRDGNDDLMKRLQMVDIFECLGIDRHIHHEIQAALDCVYRLNVYTHVKYFCRHLIHCLHSFLECKTWFCIPFWLIVIRCCEQILERTGRHRCWIKRFPHQRSQCYGLGISGSATPSI